MTVTVIQIGLDPDVIDYDSPDFARFPGLSPEILRAANDGNVEALRAAGQVGSSLQATVTLTAAPEDHALLASLGDDLKFVLIVSKVTLSAGEHTAISVRASEAQKCERCWHWRDDVGSHSEHPSLCGRCVSNLFGDGEARAHA